MFGNRKPPTQPPTYSPGAGAPAIPSSTSSTPRLSPSNAPIPLGFETIIGTHTSLKGDLHSAANARIDGDFEGSIHVDGNLMVGETAHITANIEARNLAIAGIVHGNLTGGKIQIQRTGRVWGDISATALVTEDGAFIEGKITMDSHPSAHNTDPTPASESAVPLTMPDDPTDDPNELEPEDSETAAEITLPDA